MNVEQALRDADDKNGEPVTALVIHLQGLILDAHASEADSLRIDAQRVAPVVGLSEDDAALLAEAMWFEGLIQNPTPTEPDSLSQAKSLLSAIAGLRKSHAARLTQTRGETE